MFGYVKKSDVIALLRERCNKNWELCNGYSEAIDKSENEYEKENLRDFEQHYFHAASEDTSLIRIINEKL